MDFRKDSLKESLYETTASYLRLFSLALVGVVIVTALTNDAKYFGEYEDGKEHGQGARFFVDGESYVGGWKDGEYHGQGIYTWVDGDIYRGEYKDGKENGKGTFTYLDGENYVGEWKDGLFHGQGTYTFVDGTKWIGEFKNDDFHGGTFINKDGTITEGIFVDGELQFID